MKMIVYSVSLFWFLFSVCAFAESDAQPARKITVSLFTSSVGLPALPTPENKGATPVLKAAQNIGPVNATVIAVESSASKTSLRRREYSEDQLVIVGLTADASELTRTVMMDPRLVRVEALRSEGDLSSRYLYRESVDFSFVVTEEAVVRIRILKPRWDGKKWLFDTLSEVPIS